MKIVEFTKSVNEINRNLFINSFNNRSSLTVVKLIKKSLKFIYTILRKNNFIPCKKSYPPNLTEFFKPS